MTKLNIRKPFIRQKRNGLKFGPSLTKQSHKDECNINLIVAQYDRTGLITHTKENPGIYTDLQAVDFLQSQLIVTQAKEMFQALPSKIRNKFQNDPAQFMDFMHDPDNKDEIYKLGLAENPKEPIPDPKPKPKEPEAQKQKPAD